MQGMTKRKLPKIKIPSSAEVVNDFLNCLSDSFCTGKIDGLAYEAGVANHLATKGVFTGDNIPKQEQRR